MNKCLRFFLAIIILGLTISITFLKDDKKDIKIFLLVLELSLIFIITNLNDFIKELIRENKRKNLFKKNLNICRSFAGKYKKQFETIVYSKHQDTDIINIIEIASKDIFKIRYPSNTDKQNALRASIFYEIYSNLDDVGLKESIHGQLKSTLSQYTFRSSTESENDFLNALAFERGIIGNRWKIRIKKFISGIIPTVELFNKQKQLSQLLRFKDFLKRKFAERFDPTNILKTIISKGKQNCYWIIGKNVDPNVKKYLYSLPIFAVRPGKSHNFPGFDSVIFTHYLVRIEDPHIENGNDLLLKMKSIQKDNSNMLLFIFTIASKSIEIIDPKEEKGESAFFKNELAKTIVQYFSSGVVDLLSSSSGFEAAINSGLISLEEIIQVIPLSFLIKKAPNIRLEYFDQIGEILKRNLDIVTITDWRAIRKNALINEIRNITEPNNIQLYLNSLTDKRLENICVQIRNNAQEMHKHLDL